MQFEVELLHLHECNQWTKIKKMLDAKNDVQVISEKNSAVSIHDFCQTILRRHYMNITLLFIIEMVTVHVAQLVPRSIWHPSCSKINRAALK